MVKIELIGLEFFAYHGVYQEEQHAGNNFVVHLSVSGNFNDAVTNDNIAATIDYEDLYAVVAEEMQTRSKLLEHVAGRILDRIIEAHPEIKEINIGIEKLTPPIKGKCRATKVSIHKKF
jgi:7,8-dihydroneopterin aldolase/epimerase/oxygenase